MAKSVTLLSGLPGTGKTTYLASASRSVPDTFAELVTQARAGAIFDCSDIVCLQLDTAGEDGPLDLGMKMRTIDLTCDYFNWEELKKLVVKHVDALTKEIKEGKNIRAVGIDLGPVNNTLQAWAAGERATLQTLGSSKADMSFAASEVNWNAIQAQALTLFGILSKLPCCVIGMAHLKMADAGMRTNKASAEDIERYKEGVSLRVGAEDGKAPAYTADLLKANHGVWYNHSSNAWTTRKARYNTGTIAKPEWASRYYVQTQPDDFTMTKTRRQSIVAPQEQRTLNAIFRQMGY